MGMFKKKCRTVWAWIKWVVAPDGSKTVWRTRRENWRHYSFTKKWWVIRCYYVNGCRVNIFQYFSMLGGFRG